MGSAAPTQVSMKSVDEMEKRAEALRTRIASMRAHVVAASNTAPAHASLLGASSAGNSRGDAARPAARGQQPEAADDGGHAHRQLHG